MRRLVLGWGLLLSITAFGETTQLPVIVRSNPPPLTIHIPIRVVSASKQFTVFSEDQGFAAGLAAFADKVKDRLLLSLRLPDTWHDPILITVHVETNALPQNLPAIGSSASRLERGLSYRIDCHVPPPMNQKDFVRELVKVLCVEIANRDRIIGPQEPRLAIPPLWFTEGITQNLMGDVRPLEWDLVRRDVEAHHDASLEVLLATETLPPPGMERELFEAKCKLLLRALTALPDDPHRARRFLVSLPPGAAWRDAFRTVYGDIGTDSQTAENWWAVQLKQSGGPSPLHRLTPQETDEKLMKVLTMEAVYKDPKTGREEVRKVPLMDLKDYIDAPGTRQMIQERIHQIENMEVIAHQSYLPVLGKYLEVLNHISLERFRMVRGSLHEAESLLQEVRQRNGRISASLDKFEAQQTDRDLLFLYHDYFQTFDEIKTFERSRDNSIKNYLDRFQEDHSATNAPPRQ